MALLLGITPAQKTLLDSIHQSDETVQLANNSLDLARRIKRTIKTYVSDIESKLQMESTNVAAFVWRETFLQLLNQINIAFPNAAAKDASINAINSVYPIFSVEALDISYSIIKEAVRRLSISTKDTVVQDVTDIKETMNLLWPQ